ncbi:hypothetical protein AA0111_g7949 [Alternaria arborescens]|nr:hypothetical protein AA0111_g7949 [Alternaria arborescens]RYO26605.1 hypothetical protein AA0111_g7949 [Alternaria arborescens]
MAMSKYETIMWEKEMKEQILCTSRTYPVCLEAHSNFYP